MPALSSKFVVMPSSLRDTKFFEHLVPKVHWLRQTGKALRELDRYERRRGRGREGECVSLGAVKTDRPTKAAATAHAD